MSTSDINSVQNPYKCMSGVDTEGEGKRRGDAEGNERAVRSQREGLCIPEDLHWGQNSRQYVRDAMYPRDCLEGDS